MQSGTRTPLSDVAQNGRSELLSAGQWENPGQTLSVDDSCGGSGDSPPPGSRSSRGERPSPKRRRLAPARYSPPGGRGALVDDPEEEDPDDYPSSERDLEPTTSDEEFIDDSLDSDGDFEGPPLELSDSLVSKVFELNYQNPPSTFPENHPWREVVCVLAELAYAFAEANLGPVRPLEGAEPLEADGTHPWPNPALVRSGATAFQPSGSSSSSSSGGTA